MTKNYKDQQGNKYRKTSGGWEIMRKGIGWQAFESTAYMTVISEDGAMQTIPPVEQPEPPEAAEERQVRKVREDELFVHFVDSWQAESLRTVMPHLSAEEVGEFIKESSRVACAYAQAMIDELKKRGRL